MIQLQNQTFVAVAFHLTLVHSYHGNGRIHREMDSPAVSGNVTLRDANQHKTQQKKKARPDVHASFIHYTHLFLFGAL